MIAVTNLAIRLRNLIVAEIPLWVGVVVAAVNAAAVHSPQGYVAAAGVASLRFVVSPAFEQAALKEKVVDPKFVSEVEKALAAINARQAVATAFASDPQPSPTVVDSLPPA